MWVLFLAGCAHTASVPLSEDEKSALDGKAFVYIEPEEYRDIRLIQPHHAADYSSGSISAIENGVENPAESILFSITNYLENDVGMNNLGALQGAKVNMNSEALNALNSLGADYIVSVENQSLIIFYTQHLSRYKLAGSSGFRLLSQAGIFAARGHCSYPGRDVAESPSYSELFDYEARELNALFYEAVEHCRNQFMGLLK